jgi:hypothetical protein
MLDSRRHFAAAAPSLYSRILYNCLPLSHVSLFGRFGTSFEQLWISSTNPGSPVGSLPSRRRLPAIKGPLITVLRCFFPYHMVVDDSPDMLSTFGVSSSMFQSSHNLRARRRPPPDRYSPTR